MEFRKEIDGTGRLAKPGQLPLRLSKGDTIQFVKTAKLISISPVQIENMVYDGTQGKVVDKGYILTPDELVNVKSEDLIVGNTIQFVKTIQIVSFSIKSFSYKIGDREFFLTPEELATVTVPEKVGGRKTRKSRKNRKTRRYRRV